MSDRAVFSGFGRSATRSRGGPLTVIRNEFHPVGQTRVAFAIPRRVGTAVVRNRLRRQLRALIDGLSRDGTFPDGTYLVVVSPGAKGSRSSQLRGWLIDALERMPAPVLVANGESGGI